MSVYIYTAYFHDEALQLTGSKVLSNFATQETSQGKSKKIPNSDASQF